MVTGIFDSHCHYSDAAFYSPVNEDTCFRLLPEDVNLSPDDMLDGMFNSNVSFVLTLGDDIKSSRFCAELANQHTGVYFAAGVHPESIEHCDETTYIEQLTELLHNPKAKAVGEIGLDYSYSIPRDSQQRIFERQLMLANELGLPVSVHDRDAHADTFSLIKKHGCSGVIHCYSGSVEMATEYIKLGLYLGVTGIVTFKNAIKVKQLVREIPLDNILIETDAPYIAPVPYRGYRNKSSLLEYVAEAIGELRGESAQHIIDITRENAMRLFDIG